MAAWLTRFSLSSFAVALFLMLLNLTSAADRLDSLDFNGVMVVDGSVMLSFFDPVLESNYWLSQNEGFRGLSVLDYAKDKQVVTLALDGKVRGVPLKRPTITPLRISGDLVEDELQAKVREELAFGMLVSRQIRLERKRESEKKERDRQARQIKMDGAARASQQR